MDVLCGAGRVAEKSILRTVSIPATCSLMHFARDRRSATADEEIEVRAAVGAQHVLGVEPRVPALERRRRQAATTARRRAISALSTSSSSRRFGHVQLDRRRRCGRARARRRRRLRARREVPRSHTPSRSCAHPKRVPCRESLCASAVWPAKPCCPPPPYPDSPLGRRLSVRERNLVHFEVRIVDARLEVLDISETTARPRCVAARGRRRRLDHSAVGRELPRSTAMPACSSGGPSRCGSPCVPARARPCSSPIVLPLT